MPAVRCDAVTADQTVLCCDGRLDAVLCSAVMADQTPCSAAMAYRTPCCGAAVLLTAQPSPAHSRPRSPGNNNDDGDDGDGRRLARRRRPLCKPLQASASHADLPAPYARLH